MEQPAGGRGRPPCLPSGIGGKATVDAPPNIAFVKYWGARDLERAIPANRSISMTLRRSFSRSTVEHDPALERHEVHWWGAEGLEPAPPSFGARVAAHLDRLRAWAGVGGAFRVGTRNNFPAAAGLASSASGFAALTLATVAALGREASVEELSDLARRSGSGSASRSVLGGYVEWPRGWRRGELHAFPLAPAGHWDLRDVIAVVESGPKETSSLDGHTRARSGPYWRARQRELPARLAAVRAAIAGRDLAALGEVIEEEAIDLHAVAMTSRPPIFYWKPGTLAVLAAVRALRGEGVGAWSTMDAGANVHVLCEPTDEPVVAARLEELDAVHEVIRDGVGEGPRAGEVHLF